MTVVSQWKTDFPVVRLKNLLATPITDGPHTTPEFLPSGVPFLSVDAIQNGELTFNKCRFISASDHAEFTRKARPQIDDILMGKAASTGKIARVKEPQEFSIWSPLAIIRVNQKIAEPRFTEYVLKSPEVQFEIDGYCTENTQKNISMRDIPRITVPSPAYSRQIQVANFLDRETAQIDDLIGKQERLIALLAEKRQAVITQTVAKGLDPESPTKPSGIPWIGEVNVEWAIRPLKTAGEINLGKMIQPMPKANSDVQAPYLRAANVQPDGILTVKDVKEMWFNKRELASLDVLAGDVVVVEGGIGGFGRAAFVDKDLGGFGYQNSINRIRPNEGVDGRLLTYLLLTARQSGFIHAYCTGVSMPHLTAEKLAVIQVPLPDHATQTAICDFLDQRLKSFAQLSSKASNVISILQERRSALISAAVTGKFNVLSKEL
ncbi:restriction endonuclease subunit S [Specibacter sp. NPDC078692]|uniref:restriction endonuclease subunit S n=1 Tax=Specibacter sp. NPDC078692 TaxID=3155818 RepID=UPI00341B90D3